MVHRTKRRVLDIPTDAIRPNPMQPRQVFQEAALRDLAASIRQNGILQPLTVRRTAEGWESGETAAAVDEEHGEGTARFFAEAFRAFCEPRA